jgi:hypothetical protein
MSVIHRREDQQVDQPNTLSSFFLALGICCLFYFPLETVQRLLVRYLIITHRCFSIIYIIYFHYSQCLDKEGICTDYQREEKQPDQTRTPLNQWVLLGLALSASEKVT